MDARASIRLERLRWRSRRGLLELELLLLPFVENQLLKLSGPMLDQFEALLACDDVDIVDWLLGRSNADTELIDIVLEIQNFNASRSADVGG